MNVPAFARPGSVQPSTAFPPTRSLFELSSHMHKRGKRFRTFDGASPATAVPTTARPARRSARTTASRRRTSAPVRRAVSARLPIRRATATAICGDRSTSSCVTVTIALGTATSIQCLRTDGDDERRRSRSMRWSAASARRAITGDRDPDESLLYTNLVYNDPTVVQLRSAARPGGTHRCRRSAPSPIARSTTTASSIPAR